jgi:hypothetical protein
VTARYVTAAAFTACPGTSGAVGVPVAANAAEPVRTIDPVAAAAALTVAAPVNVSDPAAVTPPAVDAPRLMIGSGGTDRPYRPTRSTPPTLAPNAVTALDPVKVIEPDAAADADTVPVPVIVSDPAAVAAAVVDVTVPVRVIDPVAAAVPAACGFRVRFTGRVSARARTAAVCTASPATTIACGRDTAVPAPVPFRVIDPDAATTPAAVAAPVRVTLPVAVIAAHAGAFLTRFTGRVSLRARTAADWTACPATIIACGLDTAVAAPVPFRVSVPVAAAAPAAETDPVRVIEPDPVAAAAVTTTGARSTTWVGGIDRPNRPSRTDAPDGSASAGGFLASTAGRTARYAAGLPPLPATTTGDGTGTDVSSSTAIDANADGAVAPTVNVVPVSPELTNCVSRPVGGVL